MLAKFNIYDFLADIVPGITFVWAIEVFLRVAGIPSPLPSSGQLSETSVIVVLGYVCGLMLQGVSEAVTEKKILLRIWKGFPSERTLLPADRTFTSERKAEILRLIGERFKVSVEPVIPEGTSAEGEAQLRRKKSQELFYLCYGYVENLSPKVLLFNAQYGMFRCLITTFALLFLLSVPVVLASWSGSFGSNWHRLLWPAALSLFTWISYLRCAKRSKDFVRAVYDLFTSGVAAPPGKGDH